MALSVTPPLPLRIQQLPHVSHCIRVACDFLADPTLASRPAELLRAFVSAAAVFNNCTQDVQVASPSPPPRRVHAHADTPPVAVLRSARG